MAPRQRHILGMLIAVVLLAGVVSLTRADDGTEIRTAAEAVTLGGGIIGSVGADVGMAPPPVLGPAFGDGSVTTTSSTAAPPPLPRAVAPVGAGPAPSIIVPPLATTIGPTSPTTSTTRPATTTTSTAPPTAVTPTTTAVIPPTTAVIPTTTVLACRNSTDPACGPFRFDPQPGADNPMTVTVVAQPTFVQAPQEVVFSVTLNDPDGVSLGSSVFFYGDGGIAQTSTDPCTKFGAWDPPARVPGAAIEVQVIRHTYFSPGTYTASFAFDAGPYDCVDAVTGRGDRPYASSATGTVTVVVI